MVRGERTSAPRAVRRWAAASWDKVATSGRPSGTAATAMATPSATACRSDARRSSARPVTAAPPARVSGRTLLVSSRSRAWTPADVSTSATAEIARCAAVPTPVATTIARACPATIVLPSNSMLARSGSLTATGSTCLSTGSDSPVSKDSSTSRSSATSSRASAGTTSGAARSMTSPGRSDLADTVTVRVACRAASKAAACCGHRRDDDAAHELVLLGEKLGGGRLGPQPLCPAGDRVDRHDAADQQRVDIAADDRRRRRPDRQDRGQRIGELDARRRSQPRHVVVSGPRSGANAGL